MTGEILQGMKTSREAKDKQEYDRINSEIKKNYY